MHRFSPPHNITSISELHRLFALPKPDHPLISVIDFATLSFRHSEVWQHFSNDFFCITIKKGTKGKFKYGQRDYDFDEGMMTFTRPGQVFSVTQINDNPVTGYMLVFKPELVRSYSLAKTIGGYGFFAYALSEALHLSEKEDGIITALLLQMQDELKNNIDHYSQDLIVAHIELLLNYANRFYNRQFITRKAAGQDLLSRLEALLDNYFGNDEKAMAGLPSVQHIAAALHLSPDYLSDLLRHLTGQNAQQYIQHYLVEKAKELLTGTGLSISEIAYHFGFAHPQSFSKLFKKKTNQTPLAYRLSFQP